MTTKTWPLAILLVSLALGLAACSNTLSGIAEDTTENFEKADETIRETGERVTN